MSVVSVIGVMLLLLAGIVALCFCVVWLENISPVKSMMSGRKLFGAEAIGCLSGLGSCICWLPLQLCSGRYTGRKR